MSNWGDVVHPAAGHLFTQHREQQEQPGYEGPRTHGKVRWR